MLCYQLSFIDLQCRRLNVAFQTYWSKGRIVRGRPSPPCFIDRERTGESLKGLLCAGIPWKIMLTGTEWDWETEKNVMEEIRNCSIVGNKKGERVSTRAFRVTWRFDCIWKWRRKKKGNHARVTYICIYQISCKLLVHVQWPNWYVFICASGHDKWWTVLNYHETKTDTTWYSSQVFQTFQLFINKFTILWRYINILKLRKTTKRGNRFPITTN